MGSFYLKVALLLTTFTTFHALITTNNVASTRRSNGGSFVSRTRVLSYTTEESFVSSTKSSQGDLVSARYLAVKALTPRKGSTAFAVDRLESNISFSKLSTRDRSFCRLLVTTTERRLGQIDKVLSQCQKEAQKKKKWSRVDHYIQGVLRVGAVQLLFLGVSPHAAVKETVDLLRLDSAVKVPESKIKFVNAVLRRLSRQGGELLASTKVTDNAAPWLVEEWKRTWGEEATARIVAAAMEETPRCLTIRQKPGMSKDARQMQSEHVASYFEESETLSQGSLRILKPPRGSVSHWPLYDTGAYWLQDVSSTLPATALYHALSDGGKKSVEGLKVVDMCAAPGGKTAQLCNFGFSVTAVEASSKRCERLRQNMKRLNMECDVAVADGTEWIPEKAVAGVLLDAPCTATGTGSKQPDVLRRDSDYSDLLKTQYDLLCNAVDNVLWPGGILVYATCSLLKDEGEEQIAKLLERRDGGKVETLPIEPGDIPGFDGAIDENGWLRVLPGALPEALGQCDGFFVARLRRVK